MTSIANDSKILRGKDKVEMYDSENVPASRNKTCQGHKIQKSSVSNLNFIEEDSTINVVLASIQVKPPKMDLDALKTREPLLAYFKMVCDSSHETFPGFRCGPGCSAIPRRPSFMMGQLVARTKTARVHQEVVEPQVRLFSLDGCALSKANKEIADDEPVSEIEDWSQNPSHSNKDQDNPSITGVESNSLSVYATQYRRFFVSITAELSVSSSAFSRYNSINSRPKVSIHLQNIFPQLSNLFMFVWMISYMMLSRFVGGVDQSSAIMMNDPTDEIVSSSVVLSVPQYHHRKTTSPLIQANIQTAVSAWITNATAATATYGNISTWDTSRVTNMDYLFGGATLFNGDISKWNTGNVTSMYAMFYLASSFNGDISKWNTGKVQFMSDMFNNALKFNGDLSSWNTSAVQSMDYLFYSATSFNQTLCWNTTITIRKADVFLGSHGKFSDVSYPDCLPQPTAKPANIQTTGWTSMILLLLMMMMMMMMKWFVRRRRSSPVYNSIIGKR